MSDTAKPDKANDGLDEIRAQQWRLVNATHTVNVEQVTLNGLVDAEKQRRGLGPEDELPLWPKKTP